PGEFIFRLLRPEPVRRLDGLVVKLAILRQRLDMGAGGKLLRRRENSLFVQDRGDGRWLVVFAHKRYWNLAAILFLGDSASTLKAEQRLERMPCTDMRKSEKRLSMNRPLTPSLSPSEGERVPEGRVRGWLMVSTHADTRKG